jgi:hypothetical protein
MVREFLHGVAQVMATKPSINQLTAAIGAAVVQREVQR